MNRLLSVLLCFCLGSAAPLVAFYAGERSVQAAADTPTSATLDAGLAASISIEPQAPQPPAVIAPADQLHDPLSAPMAAFDDLKAAKRLGWGVAFLAGAILSLRLLSKLGGFFKPLGEGKVALYLGAVGVLVLTAYNAVIQGGTWMAAAFTAIVAAAAWWDAHKQPPKQPTPA